MYTTCSPHVLSLEFSCIELVNSMNNLLSYCGLVDAKIKASDKDLPVTKMKMRQSSNVNSNNFLYFLTFFSLGWQLHEMQ